MLSHFIYRELKVTVMPSSLQCSRMFYGCAKLNSYLSTYEVSVIIPFIFIYLVCVFFFKLFFSTYYNGSSQVILPLTFRVHDYFDVERKEPTVTGPVVHCSCQTGPLVCQ